MQLRKIALLLAAVGMVGGCKLGPAGSQGGFHPGNTGNGSGQGEQGLDQAELSLTMAQPLTSAAALTSSAPLTSAAAYRVQSPAATATDAVDLTPSRYEQTFDIRLIPAAPGAPLSSYPVLFDGDLDLANQAAVQAALAKPISVPPGVYTGMQIIQGATLSVEATGSDDGIPIETRASVDSSPFGDNTTPEVAVMGTSGQTAAQFETVDFPAPLVLTASASATPSTAIATDSTTFDDCSATSSADASSSAQASTSLAASPSPTASPSTSASSTTSAEVAASGSATASVSCGSLLPPPPPMATASVTLYYDLTGALDFKPLPGEGVNFVYADGAAIDRKPLPLVAFVGTPPTPEIYQVRVTNDTDHYMTPSANWHWTMWVWPTASGDIATAEAVGLIDPGYTGSSFDADQFINTDLTPPTTVAPLTYYFHAYTSDQPLNGQTYPQSWFDVPTFQRSLTVGATTSGTMTWWDWNYGKNPEAPQTVLFDYTSTRVQ